MVDVQGTPWSKIGVAVEQEFLLGHENSASAAKILFKS